MTTCITEGSGDKTSNSFLSRSRQSCLRLCASSGAAHIPGPSWVRAPGGGGPSLLGEGGPALGLPGRCPSGPPHQRLRVCSVWGTTVSSRRNEFSKTCTAGQAALDPPRILPVVVPHKDPRPIRLQIALGSADQHMRMSMKSQSIDSSICCGVPHHTRHVGSWQGNGEVWGTHSLIRQHSSGASRGSPGWCKLPEPRRLLWWACHAVYIAGLALVGRHVGHMHLLLTLQRAVSFSCPQLSCLRLAVVLLKQSTNQRSYDEGVNAVRKPAKWCAAGTLYKRAAS